MTVVVADCPMCGMRAQETRFKAARWPLKVFNRTTGGRYPHSKKGIIKFEEIRVPEALEAQMVSILKVLADKLGYELKPKSDSDVLRSATLEAVTGFGSGFTVQTLQTVIPGDQRFKEAASLGFGVAMTLGGAYIGGVKGKIVQAFGIGTLALEGSNASRYMIPSADGRTDPGDSNPQSVHADPPPSSVGRGWTIGDPPRRPYNMF